MKINIKIGQHALERFIQHFPQLAKSLNFNNKWENSQNDPNKNFNMLILYELFKRSDEQKAILNDMAYMIEMCERNALGIEEFKMFSNHKVIFICAENKKENSITIRTVMPHDYKIGKYVPEGKGYKFNDNTKDYRLSTIKSQEYSLQVNKLLKLYPDNPLVCERLIKLKKDFEDNVQKELEVNQNSGKEEINIYKQKLDRLKEIGINYIMSSHDGLSICFLNNEYKGKDINKNKIVFIQQKIIKAFLNDIKDASIFNEEEIDEIFKINLKTLDKSDYIKLISQTVDDGINTTAMSTRQLKNILKVAIPEEIKKEIGINNKDINNTNIKIDNIIIRDYDGLNGYLGLTRHKKCDVNKVLKFHQTNKAEYFLSKHKITGELLISKFNYNSKQKLSILPTMEEYLEIIEIFANNFDNNKVKYFNDKGEKQDNPTISKEEIFKFINKELSKFTLFSQKIENAIKLCDNIQQTNLQIKQVKPNLFVA